MVYFIYGFCIGSILLAVFHYKDYARSRMQRFSKVWHVGNICIVVWRLKMLDESIVSLHTRLLRPSANFCFNLQCVHNIYGVVDNAGEDPVLMLSI
jgi:hypothetical protein